MSSTVLEGSDKENEGEITVGPRKPQIAYEKRCAVLALHWWTDMSYVRIAQSLKLSESTAKHIVAVAKVRASDPDDFDDCLACLAPMHGRGHPPKIAEGSEQSVALKELSQKDELHYQKTFVEIAKKLGIDAARSTLEKMFHEHHNLFRRYELL